MFMIIYCTAFLAYGESDFHSPFFVRFIWTWSTAQPSLRVSSNQFDNDCTADTCWGHVEEKGEKLLIGWCSISHHLKLAWIKFILKVSRMLHLHRKKLFNRDLEKWLSTMDLYKCRIWCKMNNIFYESRVANKPVATLTTARGVLVLEGPQKILWEYLQSVYDFLFTQCYCKMSLKI